jgi:hypothetical protein
MPPSTAIPASPALPVSFASLSETYRYLRRVCEPLAVRVTDSSHIAVEKGSAGQTAVENTVAEETAGFSAAALAADPAALTAVIDGESDRVRAAHGVRPRPDVAASRLLHHYLWSVCLLFSGPWYLERRVPRIPPGNVRVAPATGALTLDLRGIRTLAAADDGTTLRHAVAAHVEPLLDAFAPRLRRGPRAAWGMVTDDLASGLSFLGRCLGDEERGVREATAVLPGSTPPFPGAAGFRVLHSPSGRPHHTRTRMGCCLYYTIAPGDPCVTCPRTTDEERLRRLESARP